MFDKLKRGIKKVAGGVKKVMDKVVNDSLKIKAYEDLSGFLKKQNLSLKDIGILSICIGVGFGAALIAIDHDKKKDILTEEV